MPLGSSTVAPRLPGPGTARCARALSTGALRSALALALALGWLLAVGSPAAAVDDHRLVEPTANERITEELTIRARVDANPIEEIERVEVRLRRDGEQVGPVRALDHQGGPLRSGRSHWATPLDPLKAWAADGQAMANGRYLVQVRAISTMHTTDWRGHEVRLDVPPPRTSVGARVVDRLTRAVEVVWDPAQVPDFRRYVIQRAHGEDGSWRDVAEITSQGSSRMVDMAPDYGTWRYRVVVARAGADGGTVTSTSQSQTVIVVAPGEPEPDPPPTSDPDNGDGEGGNGNDGEPVDTGDVDDPANGNGGEGNGEGNGDDEAGEDGEDRERSVTLGPRRGTGTAPQMSRRDVPVIEREQPARPDTAPSQQRDPGQEIYEDYLSYDMEPREVTERELVVEAGSGMSDGGVITIRDRELALEQVLPPVAGGLLLFLVAGHVLRVARLDD